MRIKIEREAVVPDELKLARYYRAPDLGPKILFFSGGTALKETSIQLKKYTYNSIHIITPFDSGGSSAVIRNKFSMLAVGDIRNRLMALADETVLGNPQIYKLFSYRLSKEASPQELKNEFNDLQTGKHELIRNIPTPMRKIIRNHFMQFSGRMDDFDLRGASIGNIILTAGFLTNRRHLDPVIFIFSKLVEVRGIVRPTINKDHHLAARLKNGEIIVGQHLLTGKEADPIKEPIEEIWITDNLQSQAPIFPHIRNKLTKLIGEAELICYPIGSFYSSIIANLLPVGIGKAIANNKCPKIFVPNTGNDPELKDHSLLKQIKILLHYLKKDDPENLSNQELLNFILLDSKNGDYGQAVPFKEIEELGLKVIDCTLISEDSYPKIDPLLLSKGLLSLT